MTLQNKIDFVAIVEVNNANPNGDPLNSNIPRTTYDGYGEISDVCIKRKIRNRLIDMQQNIFVQSDEKRTDNYNSLRERAESNANFKKELGKGKKADKVLASEVACNEWIDVRSFGQVFAFKGSELSLGIRGPVSIQSAFSIDAVDITSTQITKSVNSEKKDGGGKASDTMGMKHRVDFGVYKIMGSINVQLAELTKFSLEDANLIKEALRTLFVNDASAARPDGTMSIEKLYWFEHNTKIGQYSSKKVHESITICRKDETTQPRDISDYNISYNELDGLSVEIIDGF